MTEFALFSDLRPALVYSSMNQTLADVPKAGFGLQTHASKGMQNFFKKEDLM